MVPAQNSRMNLKLFWFSSSILKERFRGIPDNRMSDPNVAFFAERNPGHLQGDELVCFCELAEEKLTKLGKRMWRKGQLLFSGQ